ncbi:alpha/beta fold hydrolase [Sphingomonas sp. GCM10030256]|uniref:alpha/beta fold hydrolase n=1 Tax=Sphingomonas sp. GCM10030256 TaxID=3273427 RepID=UPI00361B0ABE
MAAFEDRYITSADGLRLHYRDYPGPADQPPILCLPGLTRNSRDFEPVAERFAGDWRIIALDFRGRGGSDPDPQPERYMPRTYVADVLKLLDQLGIADAVFFGTSLGGIVTMVLASTDEERIAGAMINDVGPEVDQRGIERIRGFVGHPRRWDDWEAAARAFAEVQADVFPAWKHDQWLAFAHRVCREDQGGGIVLDYDMAISQPFNEANESSQFNLWPLLDGLKGKPVAVLRGELSDLFSQEVAERMVRELGEQAELITVHNVGHPPALDEPESVAAMERLLGRVRTAVRTGA